MARAMDYRYINMSQKYETLSDLFRDYSWRTPSKFIPLAKRYGFTDETEIREFLKNKAPHDERIEKPQYLPIFSRSKGEYQIDTMFVKGNPPFLIAININTRKAYGYKMKDKSSKSVKESLVKFFNEVPNVKKITSDQDSAYLSADVLTFLKEKGIDYRTTEDNNHNVLGIINRFMRTLRDLASGSGLTEARMKRIIKEYNNSPHSSLGDKSPNSITDEDEDEYIKEKTELTDSIKDTYNFNDGDHVRIVLEKNKIGKNRTNLSTVAYIIDGKDGNNFIIKASDGSIDKYPGYRLVKCDDRYDIAETIKDGKRGIVERIISYNDKKDTYRIMFDDGTYDTIPARNLREGHPLFISRMEREYWAGNKNIPAKIRKWL